MKKVDKTLPPVSKEDLESHTIEELMAKNWGNKEYREAFVLEWQRLNIAHQIHQLRLARKWTQKTIAQKTNMPQSVIARIEKGRRGFSVDTLARIAHALGKEIQLV